YFPTIFNEHTANNEYSFGQLLQKILAEFTFEKIPMNDSFKAFFVETFEFLKNKSSFAMPIESAEQLHEKVFEEQAKLIKISQERGLIELKSFVESEKKVTYPEKFHVI